MRNCTRRMHPQDKARKTWNLESYALSQPHTLVCHLTTDSTVCFATSLCGLLEHSSVYVCVLMCIYVGRWWEIEDNQEDLLGNCTHKSRKNHCETGKKGGNLNLFGGIFLKHLPMGGPMKNDRDFLAHWYTIGWPWLEPRSGGEPLVHLDLMKYIWKDSNLSKGVSVTGYGRLISVECCRGKSMGGSLPLSKPQLGLVALTGLFSSLSTEHCILTSRRQLVLSRIVRTGLWGGGLWSLEGSSGNSSTSLTLGYSTSPFLHGSKQNCVPTFPPPHAMCNPAGFLPSAGAQLWWR